MDVSYKTFIKELNIPKKERIFIRFITLGLSEAILGINYLDWRDKKLRYTLINK